MPPLSEPSCCSPGSPWSTGGSPTPSRTYAKPCDITDRGTAEAIQRPYTRLILSLNHRTMRQLDAADLAIQATEEEINDLGLTVLAAQPALFRSVLNLIAGRLDDAAAEAQTGKTIAEELGTHGFTRVGLSILAFIAMRRGDLDAAVEHIEQYQSIPAAPEMLFGPVWERWVMAAVAEAQGDPGRAIDALRTIYTDEEERRWALLTTPLAAAWMTRLALAAANRPYAQAIVDTAEYLARSNPDFPVFAVTFAHVRGIFHQDPGALAPAAADQPEPCGYVPRPPKTSASCWPPLPVLLPRRRPSSAWMRRWRVMSAWVRSGTRPGCEPGGLRALGVRRRHWAQSQRPAFGWDSLTDTERAVAGLIARGMTNRQAAERMFLSPHTVSTHLRRMFGKLDIASRAELARIVAEKCPELLEGA